MAYSFTPYPSVHTCISRPNCLVTPMQIKAPAIITTFKIFTKVVLFLQENGSNKRKKSSSSANTPNFPAEKVVKLDDTALRRSNRCRRVRGEKEITVASDQSLRDLKLQVRFMCCSSIGTCKQVSYLHIHSYCGTGKSLL